MKRKGKDWTRSLYDNLCYYPFCETIAFTDWFERDLSKIRPGKCRAFSLKDPKSCFTLLHLLQRFRWSKKLFIHHNLHRVDT